MAKIQTKQEIESQIKVIERLLESQPKVLENGKWNPKWFSLNGKLKKLQTELTKKAVSNVHDSWIKFLSK